MTNEELSSKTGSDLTENSSGLRTIGGPLLRICYGDPVTHYGAMDAPDFVPTKHELVVLAKYWLEGDLAIRFQCFCFAQIETDEFHVPRFSSRRLDRILAVLGQEAFDKIVDEVHLAFSAQVDPSIWRRFVNRELLERDEVGLPILPDEN